MRCLRRPRSNDCRRRRRSPRVTKRRIDTTFSLLRQPTLQLAPSAQLAENRRPHYPLQPTTMPPAQSLPALTPSARLESGLTSLPSAEAPALQPAARWLARMMAADACGESSWRSQLRIASATAPANPKTCRSTSDAAACRRRCRRRRATAGRSRLPVAEAAPPAQAKASLDRHGRRKPTGARPPTFGRNRQAPVRSPEVARKGSRARRRHAARSAAARERFEAARVVAARALEPHRHHAQENREATSRTTAPRSSSTSKTRPCSPTSTATAK